MHLSYVLFFVPVPLLWMRQRHDGEPLILVLAGWLSESLIGLSCFCLALGRVLAEAPSVLKTYYLLERKRERKETTKCQPMM
jgi:hypothetical protein